MIGTAPQNIPRTVVLLSGEGGGGVPTKRLSSSTGTNFRRGWYAELRLSNNFRTPDIEPKSDMLAEILV